MILYLKIFFFGAIKIKGFTFFLLGPIFSFHSRLLTGGNQTENRDIIFIELIKLKILNVYSISHLLYKNAKYLIE